MNGIHCLGAKDWIAVKRFSTQIQLGADIPVSLWRTDDYHKAHLNFSGEPIELGYFEGGVLKGYIHGYIENRMYQDAVTPILYIGGLRVAVEMQGQGIGKKLIEALAKIARSSGLSIAWCVIDDSNIKAKRVFEKCFPMHSLGNFFYVSRFVLTGQARSPKFREFELKSPSQLSTLLTRIKGLQLGPVMSEQQLFNYLSRFPEIRFFRTIEGLDQVAFAIWDQSHLKHYRFSAIKPGLRVMRASWNVLSSLLGAPKLPQDRVAASAEVIFLDPRYQGKELTNFLDRLAIASRWNQYSVTVPASSQGPTGLTTFVAKQIVYLLHLDGKSITLNENGSKVFYEQALL